MIRQMISGLLFTSIALGLASCSPMVDTRGYTIDASDLRQIVKGQSQPEDVEALLGSPSAKSTYGTPVWYYITQKKERVGIFSPEVTEQEVTEIYFDANGTVSDIKTRNKEDGKNVELVSKTTPTEGHEMTIVEQLFGNLGRFSAPGRGISQRDLGR